MICQVCGAAKLTERPCGQCGAGAYESFDAWRRARIDTRFDVTDRETKEFSRFVSRRVTPVEIADLRIQLADMLRRERHRHTKDCVCERKDDAIQGL